MTAQRLISIIGSIALVLIPVSTAAQSELTVEVTTSINCDEATFATEASGGTEPYNLIWHFGDSETSEFFGIKDFPFEVMHTYPGAGNFDWQLSALDSSGAMAETNGMVAIEGPSVTLTSEPFPPLVNLENGQATVNFSAEVSGGKAPYKLFWDLNGDGLEDQPDGPREATFTYLMAGKYQASIQVIDDCGLMGEDTLPVIVIDPDEEACHPMAQRIADGVNTLFPKQAQDLYTCEEIFDIFRGGLTGSQTGFGRLWHAYKLAQTIPDLAWEEIRDWHLDGNGWGGLVQLNRFAEMLEQHGIRELVGLVLSGDASINEIRHTVRSVLRYEADFEDALARLDAGMSPGELGRFYRIAEELQVDPAQLDEYLADGVSLQALSHAARLAERTNSDWAQVAEAHAAGYSWGEIGQAHRLADGGDWMSVLDTGIRETREQIREEDRTDREQERIGRRADQLAARYSVSAQKVLDLYHGECAQNWGCVRKTLRDQTQPSSALGQEQKAAARLARQYGVSESRVWSLYDVACQGSWSCVRAELRADSGRGGGSKPKD